MREIRRSRKNQEASKKIEKAKRNSHRRKITTTSVGCSSDIMSHYWFNQSESSNNFFLFLAEGLFLAGITGNPSSSSSSPNSFFDLAAAGFAGLFDTKVSGSSSSPNKSFFFLVGVGFDCFTGDGEEEDSSSNIPFFFFGTGAISFTGSSYIKTCFFGGGCDTGSLGWTFFTSTYYYSSNNSPFFFGWATGSVFLGIEGTSGFFVGLNEGSSS